MIFLITVLSIHFWKDSHFSTPLLFALDFMVPCLVKTIKTIIRLFFTVVT